MLDQSALFKEGRDIRVGCQLAVAVLREDRDALQRWCYPADVASLVEQTLRAIAAAAEIQKRDLAAFRPVRAWAQIGGERREITRVGSQLRFG